MSASVSRKLLDRSEYDASVPSNTSSTPTPASTRFLPISAPSPVSPTRRIEEEESDLCAAWPMTYSCLLYKPSSTSWAGLSSAIPPRSRSTRLRRSLSLWAPRKLQGEGREAEEGGIALLEM